MIRLATASAGLSTLLVLLASPCGSATPSARPPVVERDGRLAFEAESGVGDWRIIDSPTGKAIESPGAGTMRYTLRFTRPGKYYVFLLARQGPLGRDKENDVLLLLGGERLWASDGVSRPDGMRSYGPWQWTKLPKGPGHHTPRSFFNDPVYFLVREPGELTFEIAHRSANFAIDRVVLQHEDPEPPPLPPEVPPPPPRPARKS
jgi:hypothetical protein